MSHSQAENTVRCSVTVADEKILEGLDMKMQRDEPADVMVCRSPVHVLGVHFTIGRPKLSIGRPIPTVFLLVKRGTTKYGRVFRYIFEL